MGANGTIYIWLVGFNCGLKENGNVIYASDYEGEMPNYFYVNPEHISSIEYYGEENTLLTMNNSMQFLVHGNYEDIAKIIAEFYKKLDRQRSRRVTNCEEDNRC